MGSHGRVHSNQALSVVKEIGALQHKCHLSSGITAFTSRFTVLYPYVAVRQFPLDGYLGVLERSAPLSHP